ncbi:MAG: SGNH/GDSL hydrolase family protein [Akkermansiaceae bacterium]|nr:SGNH/GDSL hydrolase family protein [Akkermansiaceae bacterium]
MKRPPLIQLLTFILSAGLASAQNSTPHASKGELFEGPEFRMAFRNPQDEEGLPSVLLIGDSISIGYTIDVRKLLAGKANVHRIPGNGQTSGHGVENLPKWLGDKKWDVIHFNWGLWDVAYRHPDSKVPGKRDKVNGTLSTTPEQYRKNLEAAVAILKQTGAKLIWCATTPIPEGEPGRHAGDAAKYNEIAAEVMKKHGIGINDLHRHASKRLPEIAIQPGDVHFTDEGSAYLALQVAESILESIEAK